MSTSLVYDTLWQEVSTNSICMTSVSFYPTHLRHFQVFWWLFTLLCRRCTYHAFGQCLVIAQGHSAILHLLCSPVLHAIKGEYQQYSSILSILSSIYLLLQGKVKVSAESSTRLCRIPGLRMCTQKKRWSSRTLTWLIWPQKS